MTRVPRPLDISWNESERDGVTVVESRAATRWAVWSSTFTTLMIVPCALLILGLLLFEPLSGMRVLDTVLLAFSASLTRRQWNDKTIRLSRGAVGFFQRFSRRRAIRIMA